jgi:hypothetical protein
MKKTDYKTEIKLKHNEAPAKINLETGEIVQVTSKPNNIPEGKEIFEPDALFRKDYCNSWAFLQRELSHFEFTVCFSLALLAKAHTNSLEPLSDNTTINELMEKLRMSKNKVTPTLKTLWDYGVYGKFEVKQLSKPYTKYWLLNPYLSFSGKIIGSDIANLFKDTHIAKAFYDPTYSVGKKRLN